jgi:hypothetical protein
MPEENCFEAQKNLNTCYDTNGESDLKCVEFFNKLSECQAYHGISDSSTTETASAVGS